MERQTGNVESKVAVEVPVIYPCPAPNGWAIGRKADSGFGSFVLTMGGLNTLCPNITCVIQKAKKKARTTFKQPPPPFRSPCPFVPPGKATTPLRA